MRRISVALTVTAVALIGAGLAQASGKPVAVKAGKYAGTNSESGTVTFTISGRAIDHFKTDIGYNGKCGQGGGPGYTISVNGVSIAKNGTFSKKITLVGIAKSIGSVAGTLTGKASGSTVTGTIVDTKLQKPGQCNGYTETFTVSHS